MAASRKPVLCDDARSLGTRRPISGLTVVPDFTFDDAPHPRIILVGGQDDGTARAAPDSPDTETRLDPARLQRGGVDRLGVRSAFVLAQAGLLDGESATTNRNAYDEFEKTSPRGEALVRGVRFVSVAAWQARGLTAGVSLALRITERFCGRALAQKIADYEEWTGKRAGSPEIVELRIPFPASPALPPDGGSSTLLPPQGAGESHVCLAGVLRQVQRWIL